MPIPLDQELYARVKKETLKLYGRPSALASSHMVQEYKRRGGRYAGRTSENSGLKRWHREGWVDLARGGRTPCGRPSRRAGGPYPLCRPSRRISSKTPNTVQELSEEVLLRAMRQKHRARSHGRVSFR